MKTLSLPKHPQKPTNQTKKAYSLLRKATVKEKMKCRKQVFCELKQRDLTTEADAMISHQQKGICHLLVRQFNGSAF